MSLMRHCASTAVFALLTAVLALVAAGEPHVPPQQQPLALLLPDKDTHTKLVLQEDALELLRGQLRETPLPVVSVVGAYRTGKSFLLNELMGVGCSEGFVVGHQRQHAAAPCAGFFEVRHHLVVPRPRKRQHQHQEYICSINQ